MKKFNYYFNLYLNDDEDLYIELSKDIIEDLIKECGKNLAKCYDFQQFLYSMIDYYK